MDTASIVMAVCVGANLAAIALLSQLFRKADRAALHKWSSRLGWFVLGLVTAWFAITAWAIGKAFYSVSGIDPSQKATLLAAGISETTNCVACMVIFLLFPSIVVLGVWRRTRPPP